MTRWVGKFPSLKMSRMVGYQSLIERDFIYLLEFDPTICSYQEQPFPIHYTEEGKLRRYTPDFLVTCHDRVYLVECKHHQYIQPTKNRRKWAAAHRWCEGKQAEFVVVTEQGIRRGYLLQNVKLLHRYARMVCPQANQNDVLRVVDNKTESFPVALLLNELAFVGPHAVLPTVLYLAYHHQIGIALYDAPVTLATCIWSLHQRPSVPVVLAAMGG